MKIKNSQDDQNQYGILKYSSDNPLKDVLLRKGWFIERSSTLDHQHLLNSCNDLDKILHNSDNQIRAPLVSNKDFLDLALDSSFLKIVKSIEPKFYLNQQNLLGISSNLKGHKDQSRWHRDIPYQEWIPNGLSAFNALLCICPTTDPIHVLDLLEGSHNQIEFPHIASENKLLTQIYLKSGEYLFLNSFIFHRAPIVSCIQDHYLINQVITSRIFKQQICYSNYFSPEDYKNNALNENQEYLGLSESVRVPSSLKNISN